MRKTIANALLLTLLGMIPGQGRAGDEGRLLLVLPIFGRAPPELDLPDAGALAESILLELSEGGLRVEPQQPAGARRMAAEALETLARERGEAFGARAVVWGELEADPRCAAPRLVRIRILDLAADRVLERELCPEAAEREALARAVAISVVSALRAGEVPSLPPSPAPGAGVAIPPAPVRCPKCTPCPPAPPCPEAPRCPDCPECPVAPEDRFLLAAMASFSSHPTWDAFGIGVGVELAFRPLAGLEVGLGTRGLRSRQLGMEDVTAQYSAWPVEAWLGWRFEAGAGLEGVLAAGAGVSYSRLEAMLVDLYGTVVINRFNPYLTAHLILRWWTPWGFALQAGVGPAFALRSQKYTYRFGELQQTVLDIQTISLEAGLGLAVSFGAF